MTAARDFDSMSIDELWQLHEEVRRILQSKMKSEKDAIDERLRLLTQFDPTRRPHKPAVEIREARPRAPYPKVHPRFRNPDNPAETWSGRGLKPRWLTSQLEAGKKIETFRINNPKSARKSGRGR